MRKYIAIILAVMCILSFVGCNGKGDATKELLLLTDEFWKSVTEVVYYDFNEDKYQASDITQLEELQGIFGNLTYKEIENPWIEGWYMFEIHTNQNTYHLGISGKTISFDEKFYEVSDLTSENVLEIIKSESNTDEEVVVGNDLIPMVMVNGEIYMDTGHESTVEARCGMMDGQITSTVDGTKQPTKDNESNFGTGYSYQYGTEGTIEIYMNDKWWIFATEEARQKIQFPTSEETISYNGKEYKKSELCDATLHWLELSEQERMLSSYMPPEFMIFEETWGITLTAENVTPTSATIKCTQSGGESTGELHTGSWYILENWTQENGWKKMPYVIDGETGWNDIAWIISKGETVEWEINWEWLYGKLPVGKYRIGKEIMDFRDTGDFDKAIYFAEFEITE
jgi:hypothetical protein